MLSLGPVTLGSVAVLAPMAGMTDVVFRLLCKEQGCGLVYTELVKADALLKGVRRAVRYAETTPAEYPVGVQLYHHEPEVLAAAAAWVTEHIECDLIDLNMGCPVPRIVTRGAGAALMRDPHLVERLVSAVVNATHLPVTAKTRSGWDDSELNAVEVARAVEAAGGVALAVHARTRAQRHDGPVNWELLAQVVEAVDIPVIGNGGILESTGALAMREQTGVVAVMVGRGALGNPWIFGEIDAAWHGRPWTPPTLPERLAMVRRHVETAHEANLRWAGRERERDDAELRAAKWVRGHLVGYVRGAPGERWFLRQLNDLSTVDAIVETLEAAWTSPPSAPGPGPTHSGAPA
ncbi:MAG: tRNA dihydrouridine synthase DusB [Proteobacteria bacterium]|nr:tRNA dihydrouridine synthase DusB [Pseudomonadota bacterium]